MSIKVAYTPDGTVIREIHPTGERSYRLSSDGRWDACADHKGPWVRVHRDQVPQRFKDALELAHTQIDHDN